MAKKGGLKEVKARVLCDCSPEVAFYVCSGAVLRNVSEMGKLVESMDDTTFFYHVNQERNDFARWVEDIFQDKALASKLRKANKQKTFSDVVKKRIKELESA